MDGADVRVITGPTAAGKSALVMQMARELPLTVISADSRQIYRGFDVGTAKPWAEERARVPHEGIDIVTPETRYSAAAWADDALGWIATARAAGRTPVVVGGTGFYLRALVEPLFEEPPLDPERRQRLLGALDGLPTEELRRWCRSLDPDRAELGRTQLLRAVEVALLTGVPISRLHREAPRPRRAVARYLVVDPGPMLATWIEQRVDTMLAGGWPEEVAELTRTVPGEAPAWKATGYGVIREMVQGGLTTEEARMRVIVATRQYAKRQRTWFRHQLAGADVVRLDPRTPDAMEVARRWWRQPDHA